MPKLIATVGCLVICAGLDLLWQSQQQIRYWWETYAQFVSSIWRSRSPSRVLIAGSNFLRRQAALQVLLGLGFAFVLGPLLLVVRLTVLFYPN